MAVPQDERARLPWCGCAAATGIRQHVCLPSKRLVENEKSQVVQWCIFRVTEHVGHLLGQSLLAFTMGYKRRVLLHVVVVAVMTSMGVFPGKVRYHQDTVQHKASRIVGSIR